MFVMDYALGQGWHDPHIIPYQPFQMDPACVGTIRGHGLPGYLEALHLLCDK